MRTNHDVEIGLVRLLNAPRDVHPLIGQDFGFAEAAPEYIELFQAYLADFQYVFEIASATWEADLDALVHDGASVSDAIQSKIEIGAAGPADHPMVVWLVRRYWLLCDQLARQSLSSQPLRPEVFLLRWLSEQGLADYVQLLTAMPYWPIGVDDQGNWC